MKHAEPNVTICGVCHDRIKQRASVYYAMIAFLLARGLQSSSGCAIRLCNLSAKIKNIPPVPRIGCSPTQPKTQCASGGEPGRCTCRRARPRYVELWLQALEPALAPSTTLVATPRVATCPHAIGGQVKTRGRGARAMRIVKSWSFWATWPWQMPLSL